MTWNYDDIEFGAKLLDDSWEKKEIRSIIPFHFLIGHQKHCQPKQNGHASIGESFPWSGSHLCVRLVPVSDTLEK